MGVAATTQIVPPATAPAAPKDALSQLVDLVYDDLQDCNRAIVARMVAEAAAGLGRLRGYFG